MPRRLPSLAAVIALFAFLASTAQGHLALGEGCDGRAHSVGDRTTGYAAAARGPVEALKAPGGQQLRAYRRINQNGVRTVFGVLATVRGPDCKALWYRVQLPSRPNGARGYVAAPSVALFAVRTRIDVFLSRRRLTLFRNGTRILTTTIGVGTTDTPTPTGRYYVNQKLRADDPTGPFGPAAIGVSAFSPVLTDWAQGGPIAVHGTNDPSSVGRAASHGCIRIQNDVLRRLFRLTPTGSPVVIHA